MPLRPHAILALRNNLFSGGAHLTERGDTGLMRMLKAVAERPPVRAIDDDYRLAAANEGSNIEVDPDGGTATIELPSGLPVGYMAVVRQVGLGTVTIAPAACVTLHVFGGASPIDLAGRWAVAIAEVRGTSDWFVAGQLT